MKVPIIIVSKGHIKAPGGEGVEWGGRWRTHHVVMHKKMVLGTEVLLKNSFQNVLCCIRKGDCSLYWGWMQKHILQLQIAYQLKNFNTIRLY